MSSYHVTSTRSQSSAIEIPRAHQLPFQEPLTMDPQEFMNQICSFSLPNSSFLDNPPSYYRNNSPAAVSAARQARLEESRNKAKNLSKSTGNLSKLPTSVNQTDDKKAQVKKVKEAKKVPSNVMLLTPWVTQVNCNNLIEQVKSGDILEFNIKFHHHWGIALIPKEKKASIDSIELIHLAKDPDGHNRVVRQSMKEYWHPGVTARINNGRDVNKPPLAAGEVTNQANKLIVRPSVIWENSDKLVTFCRYGEGETTKTEAPRRGSLSRCIDLWVTMTSKPKSANTTPIVSPVTSPVTSPIFRRKRSDSVSF